MNMSRKKVIIVGGVAVGASAAARFRRLNEDVEIIIFEKGEYVSFANCGLPYHLGDVIKDRDKLIIQTPQKFKDRFNIDARTKSEVVSVNFDSKKVMVKSADKGEYEESYDYLILSPGAVAINPFKGEKVYTLRNIKDMDKIKAKIDEDGIKKAILVGGGYIGVEVAENLKHRGIDVTIVEGAPHILGQFDSEISELLEMELNDNGVGIILNDKVSEFIEDQNSVSVKLESGKEITGDIVISAIGVRPDTDFLKDTGLNLSDKGHILVDEHMQTNKEGVYAGGDAVLVKDYVTGKDAFIPLAGPANKHGVIIANNIAKIDSLYLGTIGTAILKVFDLTAASTGKSERLLKADNIEYKKIYTHPMSHAGYYPGAKPLTIKVLYGTDGRVLGAQCIGYEGADKFIDTISTVIKFRGTMDNLMELDLAYAPPYLSGKSPANMTGFVANNVKNGITDLVFPEDLKNRDRENTILVDLREEIETENGMIEGAIAIPLNSLRERLKELDKSKEIWVYCAVGVRGYIGERILKNNGFKARNLSGGYKTYKTFGYKAKSFEEGNCPRLEKKEIEPKEILEKPSIAGKKIKEVNLEGLCCPGPLMQVKMYMDMINDGDVLKATATDPGFFKDIKAWADKTGNTIVDINKGKGIVEATIIKGGRDDKEEIAVTDSRQRNGQTMVVFSGDLDKAIAAFIIANGAAAMGKNVTMFFTFWGLNVLRKHSKVKVKKSPIEKMFGKMMPRGSKKLGLSKMNMGGMGSKMIRGIMKKKNVQSLEELIEAAIKSGVKIVACTMSMDVMGIKSEELINGIEFGGVGYYLGEAEDSNSNLFI